MLIQWGEWRAKTRGGIKSVDKNKHPLQCFSCSLDMFYAHRASTASSFSPHPFFFLHTWAVSEVMSVCHCCCDTRYPGVTRGDGCQRRQHSIPLSHQIVPSEQSSDGLYCLPSLPPPLISPICASVRVRGLGGITLTAMLLEGCLHVEPVFTHICLARLSQIFFLRSEDLVVISGEYLIWPFTWLAYARFRNYATVVQKTLSPDS